MSTFTRASDNYTYVTTAATAQIFRGSGVLVAIVLNKPLLGTVKLIDNTTGSTANIATLASGTANGVTFTGRIEYNLAIGQGLIVINSAAEDITVVWRQ